jgi:hypothetical protein
VTTSDQQYTTLFITEQLEFYKEQLDKLPPAPAKWKTVVPVVVGSIGLVLSLVAFAQWFAGVDVAALTPLSVPGAAIAVLGLLLGSQADLNRRLHQSRKRELEGVIAVKQQELDAVTAIASEAGE